MNKLTNVTFSLLVCFAFFQIRSLVQQRGEQDRRLLALEEEFKKVEAKLLAAVREKTSSVSTATTLERQCVELKKINDFLKSKVCSSALTTFPSFTYLEK